MPGILLANSAHPAMKRPADDTTARTTTAAASFNSQHTIKRLKSVHHELKIKQEGANQALQGSQDEAFFQSQLLRTISLALSASGFDAVDPLALESFRAATEEYISHFLQVVSRSMRGSRRESPTPQDFAAALAQFNLNSSTLSPFLSIPSCSSITQPALDFGQHAASQGPNLDTLLGPSLKASQDQQRKKYVPNHLPELPSRHTWKATPVFPSRETDARKLREKATKEGVMAEQALRKLTEASRISKKDSKALTGPGLSGREKQIRAWDAALSSISKADEKQQSIERLDWDIDDPDIPPPTRSKLSTASANANFEEDAIVNCERLHWRETTRAKA